MVSDDTYCPHGAFPSSYSARGALPSLSSSLHNSRFGGSLAAARREHPGSVPTASGSTYLPNEPAIWAWPPMACMRWETLSLTSKNFMVQRSMHTASPLSSSGSA